MCAYKAKLNINIFVLLTFISCCTIAALVKYLPFKNKLRLNLYMIITYRIKSTILLTIWDFTIPKELWLISFPGKKAVIIALVALGNGSLVG